MHAYLVDSASINYGSELRFRLLYTCDDVRMMPAAAPVAFFHLTHAHPRTHKKEERLTQNGEKKERRCRS